MRIQKDKDNYMATIDENGNVKLNESEQETLANVEEREKRLEERVTGTSDEVFIPSEPEEDIDYKTEYEKLKSQLEENNSDTDSTKDTEDSDTQVKDSEEDLGADVFNKYFQEYTENGELSEEAYSELKSKGYPKSVVDGYIAGQKAIQETKIKEAQSIVGGEEVFNNMIQWANDNLSEQEIRAYKEVDNSGNPELLKLAIKGLYADYTKATGDTQQAGGSKAQLLKGKPTANTGIRPYTTDAEFRADLAKMNSLPVSDKVRFNATIMKRLAISKNIK